MLGIVGDSLKKPAEMASKIIGRRDKSSSNDSISIPESSSGAVPISNRSLRSMSMLGSMNPQIRESSTALLLPDAEIPKIPEENFSCMFTK